MLPLLFQHPNPALPSHLSPGTASSRTTFLLVLVEYTRSSATFVQCFRQGKTLPLISAPLVTVTQHFPLLLPLRLNTPLTSPFPPSPNHFQGPLPILFSLSLGSFLPPHAFKVPSMHIIFNPYLQFESCLQASVSTDLLSPYNLTLSGVSQLH